MDADENENIVFFYSVTLQKYKMEVTDVCEQRGYSCIGIFGIQI